MRVFLTGATGFIGTALIPELLQNGHQVLGLARSEEGAAAIRSLGAEVLRGDVNDLDLLRQGVAASDAVVHLAFNHNFATFAQNCADDRRVIETLGGALAGTHHPLVITSGTAIAISPEGESSTETSPTLSSAQNPRAASEEAAHAAAAKGVNVSIVRLAQIHDNRKQGLVPYVTQTAREKGVSVYIGDGSNRWPACPIADTARLYRLALEKAEPDAIYHAVAEEGVSMRDIAEVIGKGLNVPVKSITPEDAPAHFGWLAMFAGRSMPSSSAQTQQKLNWRPTGPSLLTDLSNMQY